MEHLVAKGVLIFWEVLAWIWNLPPNEAEAKGIWYISTWRRKVYFPREGLNYQAFIGGEYFILLLNGEFSFFLSKFPLPFYNYL